MGKLSKRNYEREQVIVRLHNEGYTYEQIGDKLNVTKGRIYQILRRITQEKEQVKV